MKKVTAFKCDFCEKVLLSRSGIRNHEKKCWLNPNRESCATCGNLFYGDYEVGKDAEWKCFEQIHKPFKQKVENCVGYDQGDGIFNDGQEY